MILLDALNEVSGRAGKKLDQVLENEETLKSILLRGFNLYNKDFNNRFLWPWRWKLMSLQTVPNYAAGSIGVTNGLRTVTGAGTAWTSLMVGRFLKLTREDELYQIVAVPTAGTLILNQPYIGDSGSGLTYLVWKKFYELDPEVPFSTCLNLSRWPHQPGAIDRKDMDESFARAYTPGFPEAWALVDIDRKISSYSTGSLTAALDSNTFTGAGTAFLGNVFAGSEIVVDGVTYNVAAVDSDTQFTSIQKVTTAISAASFTAKSRNRTRISISSVPDPAVNLYLTYPAKQFNLFSDNDELPMWEGAEHVVLDCLYGYFLEKLTSERSFEWLKVYRDECREAWRGVQEMNPVTSIVKPPIIRVNDTYRRSIYG